ncbi:MAG: HTH domain-containing protein [Chloroflexi bacterium]|nr:HTH domain-containing protein [Chloroflexota bacterium]
MNRIERLTAILLLLQEKSHTSVEIAHRFEVSKRTVLRDIQALSEMGVPVIAQAGPGGGYSLVPDYWLAPLPLTVGETFLLQLTLSAITKLSDAPFKPERASLLAKLRALLPEQPPRHPRSRPAARRGLDIQLDGMESGHNSGVAGLAYC